MSLLVRVPAEDYAAITAVALPLLTRMGQLHELAGQLPSLTEGTGAQAAGERLYTRLRIHALALHAQSRRLQAVLTQAEARGAMDDGSFTFATRGGSPWNEVGMAAGSIQTLTSPKPRHGLHFGRTRASLANVIARGFNFEKLAHKVELSEQDTARLLIWRELYLAALADVRMHAVNLGQLDATERLWQVIRDFNKQMYGK